MQVFQHPLLQVSPLCPNNNKAEWSVWQVIVTALLLLQNSSKHHTVTVFHLNQFFSCGWGTPPSTFFTNAACSQPPLVLIMRLFSPGAWVGHRSALILILHFSLKDRLKRLRWKASKTRWLSTRRKVQWGEKKDLQIIVQSRWGVCRLDKQVNHLTYTLQSQYAYLDEYLESHGMTRRDHLPPVLVFICFLMQHEGDCHLVWWTEHS